MHVADLSDRDQQPGGALRHRECVGERVQQRLGVVEVRDRRRRRRRLGAAPSRGGPRPSEHRLGAGITLWRRSLHRDRTSAGVGSCPAPLTGAAAAAAKRSRLEESGMSVGRRRGAGSYGSGAGDRHRHAGSRRGCAGDGARRSSPPPTASRTPPHPCLLPFPDNRLTRPTQTPTGLRVQLPASAMPRTLTGPLRPRAVQPPRRLQPRQRDRLTSPGSTTRRRSAHPPGRRCSTSRALRQACADRGHRRVDRQAPADLGRARRQRADRGDTDLLIHPGENFTEGHTYAVALRYLRTASGR